MAPRIDEFWISRSAAEHILLKHGLFADEVVEAAESSGIHQPAHQETDESLNATGHKRYLIPGKTDSGSRIWIIFADEGEGRGRIITAREVVGKGERERHRRMRGE